MRTAAARGADTRAGAHISIACAVPPHARSRRIECIASWRSEVRARAPGTSRSRVKTADTRGVYI